MIKTRGDKEELKGLEFKASGQDCESEIKRILLWEDENKNCKALIMRRNIQL